MSGSLRRGLTLLRLGWQARKLGEKHSEAERLLAQRALTAIFAEARGVTMKVGQLFADGEEPTPFRQLLDNIEPLPLDQALPLIDAQLGCPHAEVFAELGEATAAASLGQVHPARLRDGTQVAVKLRYPDIADAVAAELRLAGMMPGVGPVKQWGFDLAGYKSVLKQNMDRELDYLSEAQRQTAYAREVRVPGLITPRVFPQYCRRGLLVQSWESGESLDEAVTWPSDSRQAVAAILIRTLFTSLFRHGQVHGDPHMGNYFFRRTGPEVVLLDYGSTIDVDETARLALLKLILSLREGREVSVLACFAAMGFDAQKLDYLGPTLPLISRILLRTFLTGRPIRMQDWRVKEPMSQLLGDKRWWFRSAGPPSLLLLMRAFQGLNRQLQRLQAYQDWWALLCSCVGEEMLEQARDFPLPPLPDGLGRASSQALAESLVVEVLKGGRPHVKVSLPAEAALDLPSLIPEDVLQRLQAAPQVDLAAIQQRIKDSGIAPQEVFRYRHEEKEYRVWLE